MSDIQEVMNYKAWIVGGVFAVILILEHVWPAVKFSLKPLMRIIKNMSFWPINIALSLLIILPVSHFAAEHTLWVRPEWWSGVPGLLLDIIILDVFLYFWHRATHKINFLWRFHEIHHLDKHLDSTSAIRFHFGEIFFATLFRVVLILMFSLPFTSVVLFETLVLVATLFHHSNLDLPTSFEKHLSKIIVTPSIHWVHHHAIRKDTDSNYSTIFSIWDHLFKSRSKTQRFSSMEIGVEGKNEQKFKRLLLKPFLRK